MYFTRLKKNIEMDVAKKLLHNNHAVSEITNIFNSEINTISANYFNSFFAILRASTGFVIAIYMGVRLSWEITTFVLVGAFITVLVSKLFANKMATEEKKAQESNTKMNRQVQGIFNVRKTIRLFSSETIAMNKLEASFEGKRKANLKNRLLRYSVVNYLFNQPIGNITYYGLLVMSYYWVFLGRITIGEAIIFQTISHYLTSPLYIMIPEKNDIDSTKQLRDKIIAILSTKNEKVTTLQKCGDIIIDNICFGYDNDKFFEGMTARFDFGKKYLIVGKSGSGKSTLLKMILKDIEPDHGSIKYAGTILSNINHVSWYKNIAYCGQNVEIIPGSLRENIILSYEPCEQRFTEIVNAMNIGYLDAKFDNELHEDMSNFSGGELQRVAIARMLYKNSDILIFDEFSSSLDNINAYNIESMLLDIEDKLIISVSHRVQKSLLQKYDKVMIMDNGNIVRFAAPSELGEELHQYISTE